MAQELLRYQPTADGREGWHARIAELVAIANEDPPLGGAQGAGEPDPATGHRAPGAGDGKSALAKKVVSLTASSARGEPSCQIVQRVSKIMTAPSTTLVKLARTSRSPGTLSTTPGALLSLASNATWSGLTSSSRTSARVMTEPPTPSNFSSSTSSSFRPRVDTSVRWLIGFQWSSKMLHGLGS
jgi:hypothetical protein